MIRPAARALALAAFVVLVTGRAMGGPYEDGVAAAERHDYRTAVRLLRPLAERGHAASQFEIGSFYDHGLGVAPDYGEAARWYRAAAEQGFADAQNSLGSLYARGQGVTQDFAEAARWYRLAAVQGHLFAQVSLGVMYARGEGVAADREQSYYWYHRAAEQGEAGSQYVIAGRHHFGRGVPVDLAAATAWYERAARQGHAASQLQLGFHYAIGRGIAQDIVQAYLWFAVAAANPDIGAERDVAQNVRDRAFEEMTEAQRAEGRRLAATFRPRSEWRTVAAERRSEPTPPAETRPPVDAATITRIQRSLAALGYDVGRATGRMNQRTRAAIREFEAAHGHAPLGIATRALDQVLTYEVEAAREKGTVSSDALTLYGSGTAFAVSGDGHLVTAAHVVKSCRELRTAALGVLRVVATDEKTDLAILAAGAPIAAIASFRDGGPIRSGDDVIAVGFPLRSLLGDEASVTRGNVSALTGYRNAPDSLTISAPIQYGNSGGPVLDSAGNVVGLVIGTMATMRMVRAIGTVPQNVNFATKAENIAVFLAEHGIGHERRASSVAVAPADIAEIAKRFTHLVECWR